MKMTINYNSPSDIEYVTLKIHATSTNRNPKIYANGRNQLPIEISATATDSTGKILTFSQDTWISMLSLCFAESDKKLERKGTSGWCFTNEENDYSKEIIELGLRETPCISRKASNDQTIIILYAYTNVRETKRISVCLDIGGKHFTTADIAHGSEQMAVPVTALYPLDYEVRDLDITPLYNLNKTKAKVYYDKENWIDGGYSHNQLDQYFDCHYDNYYIGLKNNYTLSNAYINNCPAVWISDYNTNHNNQHMIVMHPFNTGQQTDTFGFDNKAHWKGSPYWWSTMYVKGKATFYLEQDVTYNEKPDKICLTQMAFLSSQQWELPDGCGLDRAPYSYNTWIGFYDEYGNYGQFSVEFSDDHSFIKLADR